MIELIVNFPPHIYIYILGPKNGFNKFVYLDDIKFLQSIFLVLHIIFF